MVGLFLIFTGFVSVASGEEPVRVSRDDCNLSFVVPKGVEYIEMRGVISAGEDECYVAFAYTGDLRVESVGNLPSTTEDWRAMTDFALTVKGISLVDSLAQIQSADGMLRKGLFKIISKEHVSLPGGDLYMFRFVAENSSKTMIDPREARGVVFVAGNNNRSIVFPFYSGWKLSGADKEREKIFRKLFSSIGFM
ncbi:hypothetical protein [Burkholderia pseudomultivorans]|uniref:hypothetical protein n=1 Tax=Burkholderia pseudomultivorans TaxID=1207504 RepID=UPI0018903952|nr:hypothetical protein [Burkholderia pseudomultivorans]MBF5011568.1 hypothetical protein [Burkholderia pseudomultivorans]